MDNCEVTSQALDILLAVIMPKGSTQFLKMHARFAQSSTLVPYALVIGMSLLEPPEQQATWPPSSCSHFICFLCLNGILVGSRSH